MRLEGHASLPTDAAQAGLFESFFPSIMAQRDVPQWSVEFGYGKRGPKTATLPPDLQQEVQGLIDASLESFERFVVVGLSRSEKTPTGRPKVKRLDLLNHKLQYELHEGGLSSAHDRTRVYQALRRARQSLEDSLLDASVAVPLVE